MMSFQPSSRAEWDINGYVGLTTNYVYRGLSYTGDRINPYANVNFFHDSGFFINTWLTQDDIAGLLGESDQKRDFELELNLGYNWQINQDWSVAFSRAWFEYHRIHQPTKHDYTEYRASINYTDQYSVFIAHTNSVWNRGFAQTTYSFTARHASWFNTFLETEIGLLDFSSSPDERIPYLRVELAKSLSNRFVVSIEYNFSDTDSDSFFNSKRTGSQVSSSLSFYF